VQTLRRIRVGTSIADIITGNMRMGGNSIGTMTMSGAMSGATAIWCGLARIVIGMKDMADHQTNAAGIMLGAGITLLQFAFAPQCSAEAIYWGAPSRPPQIIK